MTSEQFSELWKMLEEFDFEELVNIPTGWKCGKCEKVLKNACLVACECLYCRNCFEKMRAEGLTFCIGSKVKCKSSVLSNCVERFKKDEKISKLVVKCPQQDCSTKCELIKMVDHLKLCPKLGVKCLFHGLGCLQDKIEREKIQDHFVAEQERHSKILLDMIGTLRNEIDENSGNTIKIEEEISMLKRRLTLKDEEIRSLKQEIESIKTENGHLKEEFGKQFVKMKSEINTEITSVSTACSLLMEDLLQQDSRDESRTPPWTSLPTIEVKKSLESVDQSIACVQFEWPIDKVVEQQNLDLFSPTFTDDKDSYKIILIFKKVGKLIQISFQDMLFLDKVQSGITGSKSQVKATIQIMNKAQPTVTKSITKMCPLEDHTSDNPAKSPFKFEMDDLEKQGLLLGNGCIVKFMANYLT